MKQVMNAREFRPRPVQTVFALIGVAILATLGSWQLHRLDWKQSLIEQVETRASRAPMPLDAALELYSRGDSIEYFPVEAQGRFAHDLEAHVFGSYEGAPGYYIFSPLRLSCDNPQAEFVYVNRGFVPQALKSPAERPAGQVEGCVRVTGLARAPEKRGGVAAWVAPQNDPAQNRWYLRNPALFAAHAGLEAAPIIIDSDGTAQAADWPKGGTTRIDFSNRHMEYALTWFGLAGALIAVWVAVSLRRRP